MGRAKTNRSSSLHLRLQPEHAAQLDHWADQYATSINVIVEALIDHARTLGSIPQLTHSRSSAPVLWPAKNPADGT